MADMDGGSREELTMEKEGGHKPWRRADDEGLEEGDDEGLKEGAKPFLELRGGAVARRKQYLQGREERTRRGSCAGELRRGRAARGSRGSAWGSC